MIAAGAASATTGVESLPYGKPSATQMVGEIYYNLQGQRMASPLTDGIYIVSRKMSDGSVQNVKVKK